MSGRIDACLTVRTQAIARRIAYDSALL